MRRIGTLSIGKYGHGVDLLNDVMEIEQGNYSVFIDEDSLRRHKISRVEEELFTLIERDLYDIRDMGTVGGNSNLNFFAERILTNLQAIKQRIKESR